MFKDNDHPWLVYHDGEVRMSNNMKCHRVTKGKQVLMKELKKFDLAKT
jgi:hypothetical protein